MSSNLENSSDTEKPVNGPKSEISDSAPAKYTGILLAGARSKNDPVASVFGEKYKALVPLVGRPMIAYALDALKNAKHIDKIIVVFDGNEALETDNIKLHQELNAPDVKVISTANSICQSVKNAIEQDGGKWPYLVTTADHALLTPEVIDYFCEHVGERQGLCAGFVEKRYIDEAHPSSKRTYIPFKDAMLSGANLFAFTCANSLNILDFWESVENERKTPWRLFRAFGPVNMLGLMLRRFTIASAFGRASKVLGVEVAAITLPYAEAAIDVDSPKDYMQVTKILEDRTAFLP
jgi:GTP:adenosylcobinamide-phosphate guanylyltransferase